MRRSSSDEEQTEDEDELEVDEGRLVLPLALSRGVLRGATDWEVPPLRVATGRSRSEPLEGI